MSDKLPRPYCSRKRGSFCGKSPFLAEAPKVPGFTDIAGLSMLSRWAPTIGLCIIIPKS